MSEHENGQVATVQRPTTDKREDWKTYWEAQEQPWRTEPEILPERQKCLTERLTGEVDATPRNKPFKDMKLSRADVEWLLVTYNNWQSANYPSSSQEGSLNLNGADLSKVDLQGLPLTKVTFIEAHLEEASLNKTDLEGAVFVNAHLEGARLDGAHLEKARLWNAHLQQASLSETHLENAHLHQAHLEKAFLWKAHLEGAMLELAHLDGSYLRAAYFSDETNLKDVILSSDTYGPAALADIHWGDANLAVLDWRTVKVLGDEQRASRSIRERIIIHEDVAEECQTAVRAYRQVSRGLQAQGLNENAARFAYRAQLLQRTVFWHQLLQHDVKLRQKQRVLRIWLASCFFDLLAGYGYRPGRSVLWYLAVVIGFACAYHLWGGLSLWPPDALVFSIMSFHGRGFFPSLSSETNLHNPLVMLAALEAIIGLLIEISFIATFTRRYFGT